MLLITTEFFSCDGRVILHFFLQACLSLFYRYFHDVHSEEYHSLIPLVPTFIARIGHATSAESNHSHFPHFFFKCKKEVFTEELLLSVTLLRAWVVPCKL